MAMVRVCSCRVRVVAASAPKPGSGTERDPGYGLSVNDAGKLTAPSAKLSSLFQKHPDQCGCFPEGFSVRWMLLTLEWEQNTVLQREYVARAQTETSIFAWIHEEGFLWRNNENPSCDFEQGCRRKAWWLGVRARQTQITRKIGWRVLHVADLLSPISHGPNLGSFDLDLRDPTLYDPRQQIKGTNHRSSWVSDDLDKHKENRTKTEPDLDHCLQPEQVTNFCFQILINTPQGKSRLVWVHAGDSSSQLKQKIWTEMGFPVQIQHLVSGRRSLQDCRSLESYEIGPGSIITLNFRLRGGVLPQGQTSSSGGEKGKKTAAQHHTKGGISFKNILQGSRNSGLSPDQGGHMPRPYIVDQSKQTPALNLDSSGIDDVVKAYETQALIYCFNSFWPKPLDLFHWIFTSWTMECDIHLCSKGFFIVKFTSKEVRDTVISSGPWFWGTSGLFMTPWFPNFDPNKMTVTKMPVWIRLYNLPLHFWHERVLESIGNSIGKYVKTDLERIDERIYTFARICVEVDLSKGLSDNIRLVYKQQNWLQVLDYENTAFRCRLCRQTGHLQSTCPEAKNKKKQKGKQKKGWHFSPPDSEDEESEAAEEENPAEKTEVSQEMENQKETPSVNKAEKFIMDPSTGGNKRHHQSDTSDSDKESGPQNAETQIVIASIEPSHGEWRKVEKKKGRKT